MFDIGFSELMVIGIVALLVLGPERLPKVARTTGHLLGRLQRYVSDVKSDINREMQLDELKKLQEEARKSAMAFEGTVRSEMAGVESGLSSSLQSASSAIGDLENTLKSTPPASASLTAASPIAWALTFSPLRCASSTAAFTSSRCSVVDWRMGSSPQE